MKKRILALCIIVVIVLSLGACSDYSENVELIEGDGGGVLLYQGAEYYASRLFCGIMDHELNEKDIELGWYYSFPFSTRYYSDTREAPDYVFGVGGGQEVYLKQGYDYGSEVFVIEGTSDKIVFSEAMTGDSLEYNYFTQSQGEKGITMCSEKHPNLKIRASLFFDGSGWCIGFGTDEAYVISPSLLEILKENGFIA